MVTSRHIILRNNKILQMKNWRNQSILQSLCSSHSCCSSLLLTLRKWSMILFRFKCQQSFNLIWKASKSVLMKFTNWNLNNSQCLDTCSLKRETIILFSNKMVISWTKLCLCFVSLWPEKCLLMLSHTKSSLSLKRLSLFLSLKELRLRTEWKLKLFQLKVISLNVPNKSRFRGTQTKKP